MFPSLFRRSLLVKFSIIVIGMTMISVLITSVTFFIYERDREHAGIEERARTFGLFATAEIYDIYIRSYTHPAASSFTVFAESLKDIMSANPDAHRIELVAINGRILFDSEEMVRGKYMGPDRFIEDTELLDLARKDELSVRQFREPADQTDFQVIVPVRAIENVHTLSMVYSFSYSSMEERQEALITRLLLTALPLMAVGVILPLLVLPSIIRPIRRLQGAAQQVSAGDFNVEVVAETGDEIGALSRSFAHMVEELKKSQAALLAKIDELGRVNKVMVGRELRMAELKKKLGEQ